MAILLYSWRRDDMSALCVTINFIIYVTLRRHSEIITLLQLLYVVFCCILCGEVLHNDII